MEIYGLLAVGGGIYDLPVIKQISWVLGQVMNGLYNLMSLIGIDNIGISIIIFTVIVYTILMPLTIKQQKFSKMQSVMQPELQKIQKKYANKKRPGFYDEAAGRDEPALRQIRSKDVQRMSAVTDADPDPVRTLPGRHVCAGVCNKGKECLPSSCGKDPGYIRISGNH